MSPPSWSPGKTWAHQNRLVLEELAVDCLDIRELHRHGYLDLPRVPRGWPEIRRIRTSRHLIYIELRNQVTPQQIHIRGRHATSEAADPGCIVRTVIEG